MRSINQQVQNYIEQHMNKIIQRTNQDPELALCFRKDIIEIYYQGINLLKISFMKDTIDYEISSGIFRISSTSYKASSNKPLIKTLIEEMLELRKKFIDNFWVLQAKVTNKNLVKSKIYLDFCKMINNYTNCLINDEIDAWVKHTNKHDKTIKDKYSLQLNTTFKINTKPLNHQEILYFWLENLDSLKRIVDIYFLTTRVQKEKILQNHLFRNYIFPELTPIDIEYNIPSISNKERKGRPDIIAMAKDYISLIEVKYNNNSLFNKAGVIEHAIDFVSLISNPNQTQLKEMIDDIISINRFRKTHNTLPYENNTKLNKLTYEIIYGFDDPKYLKDISESVCELKEFLKNVDKKIIIDDQVIRIEFVVYLLNLKLNDLHKIKSLRLFEKEVIFY